MNKLVIYTVRDRLAGDSSLILTAKNEPILRRNIKGVLLSKQQNFINTDTPDKEIYESGYIDTDTGKIVGLENPVFVVNVEELRQELISEIRQKQAEAGIPENPQKEDLPDGGNN